MSDLLAEADRLALSELHDMLDCVQSDLSVDVEELESIRPQGTLGETLKEVLVEYVKLRKDASVDSIKLRAGWVCKDQDGMWFCEHKPELRVDGKWTTPGSLYLSKRVFTDPWPDKQIGGPECCMEVRQC